MREKERENALHVIKHQIIICRTLSRIVVVLSVIKSFITQLKFLCNADNDCVDSCDSGDDVLLFLYHVNNKSTFFSALSP